MPEPSLDLLDADVDQRPEGLVRFQGRPGRGEKRLKGRIRGEYTPAGRGG